MNYRVLLSYNPVEADALKAVLERYHEQHHNALVTDFEKMVGQLTGVKYVVALNSGTAAIHLALKVLGVGTGDEVLVSTFTYVASVNPILYLGAVPVFIDSEAYTWNMDPELLEQAIVSGVKRNKKPKAIIVVHAYGMPAQMDRIRDIALHYAIPILEDAAEAFGAQYKGQPVGGLTDVGILSFNNNKIVTTYGGGALLTNREELYHLAVLLAGQAREREVFYHHEKVGYSYLMGPLNAAAGLVQVARLKEKVDLRRALFEKYVRMLRDLPIGFLAEPPQMKGNRWLTTMVWSYRKAPDLARKTVAYLGEQGIETRLLWNPMHKQPIFKGFNAFLNGTGEHLFAYGLCLPSGEDVHDDVAEEIKNGLQHVLKVYQRAD